MSGQTGLVCGSISHPIPSAEVAWMSPTLSPFVNPAGVLPQKNIRYPPPRSSGSLCTIGCGKLR